MEFAEMAAFAMEQELTAGKLAAILRCFVKLS